MQPLVERGEQLGQPAAGVAAPGAEQGGPGPADQLGVTGDDAQVEQPDAGAELAAGDVGALGRRPDRVVEPDPRVPERIPEPVGQGVDPRRSLAVVQQHEVDVGAWAELTPGQAADGGQRDAAWPGRATSA